MITLRNVNVNKTIGILPPMTMFNCSNIDSLYIYNTTTVGALIVLHASVTNTLYIDGMRNLAMTIDSEAALIMSSLTNSSTATINNLENEYCYSEHTGIGLMLFYFSM